MIATPPLLSGAVKETVAAPAVETDADTDVGVFGTVAGIAALDAADAEELKSPLFAVALNVYGVPFVKPVTTQLVALEDAWQGVPTALLLASYAVIVYVEIAGPPVALPVTGLKVTVAWVLPRTAFTPVGASGAPAGVTEADVAAADVPVELPAVTLNV